MPSSFQQAGTIALFFSLGSCHACPDWCVAPRCSCQDVIPGLSTFLEGTLGIQSISRRYLQRATCVAGFSGRQCSCGFSRTNIADDYGACFLSPIPDFDKASMTVTTTGSARGLILVGTWTDGYEATVSNPTEFSAWDAPKDIYWSVGKTASGNQLVGGEFGIKLKKSGDSEFVSVLDFAAYGGIVATDDYVFAATQGGLYVSNDGGETWEQSPTDCQPYSATPSPSPMPGDPKPPQEDRYCKASCSHLLLLDDGSLIAFYDSYGGAYQIQLQDGVDPLLEESWVAFPSFQDGETCQSAYCPTNAAAILDNYMYVAKLSLGLVRINLDQPLLWEDVVIGTNDVDGNELIALALVKVSDGSLLASTDYGLYHTTDGENWIEVSEDACNDSERPPYPTQGMVHVIDSSEADVIIFGTSLGPWVYKY